MENYYTNIKERILYYARNQGIGIENFLSSIGMTYGSFKGKAKKGSINSDAIVKIYTKYPDLNYEWLLTGKGEMLKGKEREKESFVSEEPHVYLRKNNEEELKDRLIIQQEKNIKLVEEVSMLKTKILELEAELRLAKSKAEESRNKRAKHKLIIKDDPVQHPEKLEHK